MIPFTDTLKTATIWVLAGLCISLGGACALFLYQARLAEVDRDVAKARAEANGERADRMADAIERNKKQAADMLRTQNASILALQSRLDASHLEGEKQSVLDKKVAADAGLALDRFRAGARLRSTQSAAARAGGGRGGDAQQAATAAGAEGGAGDVAGAGGLLRETAIAEGDEDAKRADLINVAYASCRADAYRVREVAAQVVLTTGESFASALDPPERGFALWQ